MPHKPPDTAPRDRIIDVRVLGEDLWVRVLWSAANGWFDVLDDESWLEPDEIDAWREAPHPSIGIGSPKA